MKSALRALVTVASVMLPVGQALADGPYGDQDPSYGQQDPSYGQQDQSYGQPDPAYGQQDPNPQPYQPPPDGTCLDDNQQAYDCSNDSDYASYSHLDDGYDTSAYQDFHSTLAPYGNWINSDQYGQVWVPGSGSVGADFTPYYSGGRWSMTDYGWTWVSDYNWGWAPFHYGRWVTLPGHGWSWVPGRIWGPAWVHWRTGGGYVGWAALPPRGMRISAPLYGGYGGRFHSWNFVPMGQITSPRLVRVAPYLAVGLYGRTTISGELRSIGSSRIVYGPSLHHFAGAGIQIAPTPLRSYQMAMPRSGIVGRPSLPLASRAYYAPAARSFAPGSGRPLGYPPAPLRTPGYPQPGYSRPGYQPQPGYPQPGYQQPGYPQPGYQQPGYPRPSLQAPSPGYQHPSYPQPSPGYQRPSYPQPSPGYQRPSYPQPSPGYQHPSYPQPSPSYPRPAYQPPVHQAPSYQQPAYHAPAYSPPAHQAPSYQQPAYHAPAPPAYHAPSAPSAPSHAAPAGGGGHHR